MNVKDQLFEEIGKPSDFKFGTTVATVFDDMANRSVPFYGEIQRMMAEIAAGYAKDGTVIYDLGCATGTTLLGLNTSVPENIRFIGIDDSPEMLAKCRSKLDAAGFKRPYELHVADLNGSIAIENASVVVLCLTLQFVRPIYRSKLLQSIADGLTSGGILILVEKILPENQQYNSEFIQHYYNYKRRNQYSEMEIANKREALENVLIPYKLSENVAILREAGFANTEVFFKWYNFCGLMAFKA